MSASTYRDMKQRWLDKFRIEDFHVYIGVTKEEYHAERISISVQIQLMVCTLVTFYMNKLVSDIDYDDTDVRDEMLIKSHLYEKQISFEKLEQQYGNIDSSLEVVSIRRKLPVVMGDRKDWVFIINDPTKAVGDRTNLYQFNQAVLDDCTYAFTNIMDYKTHLVKLLNANILHTKHKSYAQMVSENPIWNAPYQIIFLERTIYDVFSHSKWYGYSDILAINDGTNIRKQYNKTLDSTYEKIVDNIAIFFSLKKYLELSNKIDLKHVCSIYQINKLYSKEIIKTEVIANNIYFEFPKNENMYILDFVSFYPSMIFQSPHLLKYFPFIAKMGYKYISLDASVDEKYRCTKQCDSIKLVYYGHGLYVTSEEYAKFLPWHPQLTHLIEICSCEPVDYSMYKPLMDIKMDVEYPQEIRNFAKQVINGGFTNAYRYLNILLRTYARMILKEITTKCGGISFLIDSLLLTKEQYELVLKTYPDLIGNEPGQLKVCFTDCSIIGSTHGYEVRDAVGNLLKQR